MVRLVVWGGLAVVILAVLFAFVREQRAPSSSPVDSGLGRSDLPVISQLTDFKLTNQLAGPVGLDRFANKVWFANIIFTRCPGPCPVMTQRMAELQAYFADEPDVVGDLPRPPVEREDPIGRDQFDRHRATCSIRGGVGRLGPGFGDWWSGVRIGLWPPGVRRR